MEAPKVLCPMTFCTYISADQRHHWIWCTRPLLLFGRWCWTEEYFVPQPGASYQARNSPPHGQEQFHVHHYAWWGVWKLRSCAYHRLYVSNYWTGSCVVVKAFEFWGSCFWGDFSGQSFCEECFSYLQQCLAGLFQLSGLPTPTIIWSIMQLQAPR